MAQWFSSRFARWTLGAALLSAAASPAAASSCAQVQDLVSQGLSLGQVAAALGAPVGAVQACLQPRSVPAPPGRVPVGPAGPAPFGAAGPAPWGAAGPAPLGAAGPPPLGAPGPPPLGAAGPAPLGSGPIKTTR